MPAQAPVASTLCSGGVEVGLCSVKLGLKPKLSLTGQITAQDTLTQPIQATGTYTSAAQWWLGNWVLGQLSVMSISDGINGWTLYHEITSAVSWKARIKPIGIRGSHKIKKTTWDDIVLMITAAHTVRFLHFATRFGHFLEKVPNAPKKAGK